MTDRYAVIGHPVSHSLSPDIHAQFAAQTGQYLEYGRIEAPLDGFARMASAFFASGGAGLNVTVPFKGEACEWVNDLDELAREADAVNTIARRGDGLHGFNTDGLGLVRDLVALRVPLGGASVLLLGAGGAARGVLRPLLRAGVARLVVANRTPGRAFDLARASADPRVSGAALASLTGSFDLVINATSAGLSSQGALIAPGPVRGAVCYDMLYRRDGVTDFTRWAAQAGAARCHDGLGMLVEQAAEAFHLWRGVRPDARRVLAGLRPGG